MATTKETNEVPGRARELAENEAMCFPRSVSVVRVERGTVLVTQEGDLEDHVLEAGDELVLRRHGLAVAWAFTAATISLGLSGLAGWRRWPLQPGQPPAPALAE